MKPIFLFADSQLLFWKKEQKPFLTSLLQHVDTPRPTAAYLGASNGNAPEFFAFFQAAFQAIGLQACHQVYSLPGHPSERHLREADILFLAGGDVKMGWDAFCRSGQTDLIKARYSQGALLIGLSAGAMQLGAWSWEDDCPEPNTLFPVLGLVPAIVSVHEDAHWPQLRAAMSLLKGKTPRPGLGIPSGGGVVFQPDGRMENLRHPSIQIPG